MNNCNNCGSILLDKIDFNTNKNTQVCINCDNIEPTNRSIVNASPLLFPKFSCELQPIEDKPIQPDPEDRIVLPHEYRKYKDKDSYVRDPLPTLTTTPTPKEFYTGKIAIDWTPVIGYEQIKSIINATLNTTYTKKKTHILIVGAAGTSKTVFLKTIETSMVKQGLNVHYLDATTLSSSGVIQYLFDNEVQYCLLDEIDKLEKEHQKVFLNLLESGILQETKGTISRDPSKSKIRKKEMKQTIFICTGNYIEKIMYPLLTRFLTLNIPEYTKSQFYDIGLELLTKNYNKPKDVAYYIIDHVYKLYTEKKKEKVNLRTAVQVAILTYGNNSKEFIDSILAGMYEYATKYEE